MERLPRRLRLLNGRVYPDTIAPNGRSTATSLQPRDDDADGDLIAPAGHPELQYQPHSSLVTCKAGERVLLRFANLGFRESAMTIAGIQMKVVGATRRRCGAATAPTQSTRPTRSNRRRRELRRDLHGPAVQRRPGRTTPTCSTTAATPGRTTSREGGYGGQAPRSASTRPALPAAVDPQHQARTRTTARGY